MVVNIVHLVKFQLMVNATRRLLFVNVLIFIIALKFVLICEDKLDTFLLNCSSFRWKKIKIFSNAWFEV